MQVNTVNNTNFKAQIIPSKALDSALELAQSEAIKGTKDGLKMASQFYNNLRTIEKDKTAETFFVDATPVRFYPHMRLGHCIRLLEFHGRSSKDIAFSVIDGVRKLVEGKYFPTEIANEAKDTDLTKAFLRWI